MLACCLVASHTLCVDLHLVVSPGQLGWQRINTTRPVARIFRGGGGGVRTSRTGTKYLIDDTPCMQVPTTQGQSVEPTN